MIKAYDSIFSGTVNQINTQVSENILLCGLKLLKMSAFNRLNLYRLPKQAFSGVLTYTFDTVWGKGGARQMQDLCTCGIPEVC